MIFEEERSKKDSDIVRTASPVSVGGWRHEAARQSASIVFTAKCPVSTLSDQTRDNPVTSLPSLQPCHNFYQYCKLCHGHWTISWDGPWLETNWLANTFLLEKKQIVQPYFQPSLRFSTQQSRTNWRGARVCWMLHFVSPGVMKLLLGKCCME